MANDAFTRTLPNWIGSYTTSTRAASSSSPRDAVAGPLRRAPPELKGSRYLWLKNDANLTSAQKVERGSLAKANLENGVRVGHAARDPEHLQGADAGMGDRKFNRWCSRAKRSRLEPIKSVAATLRRHETGILA